MVAIYLRILRVSKYYHYRHILRHILTQSKYWFGNDPFTYTFYCIICVLKMYIVGQENFQIFVQRICIHMMYLWICCLARVFVLEVYFTLYQKRYSKYIVSGVRTENHYSYLIGVKALNIWRDIRHNWISYT